jgi:lipopolysaccharide/colanic/teichoic acid biosynthesis glycosyltransferase
MNEGAIVKGYDRPAMELVIAGQGSVEARRRGKVYEVVKRVFDIAFALCALAIASPVMLLVALLIVAEDKGPIFYSSTRVGENERTFRLYKFRSMYVGADKNLDNVRALNVLGTGPRFKLKNDPRVTKVGKFLRKTSIDELPQFINILLGDMSVVGPRPHSVYEVEQYSLYDRQRFQVAGGLACFSECCGRSNLTFEQSIELDMKYLRERGLLTDLKIILMTAISVIKKEGAA